VTYNWDSHAVNCCIFTDSKYRFPMYDRAVTALIEDLYARGLDRRVLLIVTGEFGRTPRLSYSNGRPGRDHWPQAMSMLLSGGGLRMGQVIGSTNSRRRTSEGSTDDAEHMWRRCFATSASIRGDELRGPHGPTDADPAVRLADRGVI